jgi:nucleoside phosphorylase
MSVPWETRIAGIVDGWLFAGDDPLPESLIIPLENPHLFDGSGWETLGLAQSDLGVVSVHRYDDVPVGVAKPVLGAAACAMLVDAASRRGVRTIVGVGFCGGTSPHVGSGTVIAATTAVAADGVSAAYTPGVDAVPASSALLARIGTALPTGPVHSVAAVHLEDQKLVDSCARTGILGLDMETASLYAVARSRGLDALALLVVSDVPARGLPAHLPGLIDGVRRAVGCAAMLAIGQSPSRS